MKPLPRKYITSNELSIQLPIDPNVAFMCIQTTLLFDLRTVRSTYFHSIVDSIKILFTHIDVKKRELKGYLRSIAVKLVSISHLNVFKSIKSLFLNTNLILLKMIIVVRDKYVLDDTYYQTNIFLSNFQ